MHLVGFIIRIYHDARSPGLQTLRMTAVECTAPNTPRGITKSIFPHSVLLCMCVLFDEAIKDFLWVVRFSRESATSTLNRINQYTNNATNKRSIYSNISYKHIMNSYIYTANFRIFHCIWCCHYFRHSINAWLITIISNLSNDRSKASCKTVPPHSAI